MSVRSANLAFYFNSRPSARGDSVGGFIFCTALIFQFTPLREGRHRQFPIPRIAERFQFTPLREGRQIVSAFSQSCLLFQFTPLREGRLCRGLYFLYRPHISIHAPPRGATFLGRIMYPHHDFNSRPSARGDLFHHIRILLPSISIHAPPRGATIAISFNSRLICVFQFTPLREGRPSGTSKRKRAKRFQFTPLREGRRQKICNFCKSFVQPLQISMA